MSRQDEFRRGAADDDQLHVLRILEAPGIDKTMISSYVVEELQKKEGSTATFIFYVCNDMVGGRRTTPAIVCGLPVRR